MGAVVEARYITYREAETYTGRSRWTLYRAVRAGELRACGSGKAVRFDVRDLDAWMHSEER